jgi:hypothetical protein
LTAFRFDAVAKVLRKEAGVARNEDARRRAFRLNLKRTVQDVADLLQIRVKMRGSPMTFLQLAENNLEAARPVFDADKPAIDRACVDIWTIGRNVRGTYENSGHVDSSPQMLGHCA